MYVVLSCPSWCNDEIQTIIIPDKCETGYGDSRDSKREKAKKGERGTT